MSIYKLNSNLTTTRKIELLNSMILELYGMVKQGKFDINEIESIYDEIGSAYSRKYLRDQSLGNTLGTYSGWTHLKAETAYSIWKFSPTSYSYDATNEFYFDDKYLTPKGQATSESATTFDSVFFLSGSTYTNNTTEAGTEEGTEFEVMSDTSDYLYIGDDAIFSGVKFEFATRGSNYTLKLEYWNGSAWTEITANTHSLVDGTSNFEGDGAITWGTLTSWATTTVNSTSRYWIRISTTTTPVTTAEIYYLIPSASVIALLALSTSEVLNEDWAWCSYGSAIYITVRNAGAAAYEGDYYITSSSSATNLQNFWVYNHEVKGNYKNSSYT